MSLPNFSKVHHRTFGYGLIVGVNGRYLRISPIGESYIGEAPAEDIRSVKKFPSQLERLAS